MGVFLPPKTALFVPEEVEGTDLAFALLPVCCADGEGEDDEKP